MTVSILARRYTYTDDDVNRLVESARCAQEYLGLWEEGDDPFPMEKYVALKEALAPFQCDPDAEVIEAMAKAMHDVDGQEIVCTDWTRCAYADSYREKARAALAAYRAHTNGGAS